MIKRLAVVTVLASSVLVPQAHAAEAGPEVCAQHAHQAGFRGVNLVEAIAIGMAESGCRTYFHDPEPADQGMWQIRVVPGDPWRDNTDGELLDPAFNARATFHISGGGADWSAWSTSLPSSPNYYLRYWTQAHRAAARYFPSRFSMDVNGNGVSDFGVWRGSDQMFNVLFDSGGVYHRQWGSAGDVAVAGDFDGNGLSDFVTFTPATGMWHVLYDNGQQYHRQWGGPGQIPVAGDFDGNGVSDYVTFTPNDGNWHVLYDSGQQYHRQWGGPGQIPVGGDFDGNGASDYVTYTPNDGNWHILYDNGQQYHRAYGGSNYQPI